MFLVRHSNVWLLFLNSLSSDRIVMRKLLASSLLLLSGVVNANTIMSTGSIAISSDQYDVIACEQSSTGICSSSLSLMVPEQFAKNQGYKTIRRRYVAISGNTSYIIMEVER